MATIVEQLETELNLAPGTFSAAFGTEVRQLDAKINAVRAERDAAMVAFEATLTELAVLRAEAQARIDDALGKA